VARESRSGKPSRVDDPSGPGAVVAGDRLQGMKRVTLEYQGKEITAALNREQTLSGQALSQDTPPMWHVTIGATALTKFPATSADTEASVRGRILAWLKAHPDMLDRDQIVLGGG